MNCWTTGVTVLLVTLIAIMTLGSTGCVSQEEVDRFQSLYRKSQEQVVDLRRELEEAQARIDALQARQSDTDDLDRELGRLRDERDELSAALAEAENQLREMGSPLEIPEELSDRLAELARENPELMSYDPDLGMVQLQSDLTFDLGSADVRDSARASLERLANVLTSSEARQFEIRVVGHTDSVPIGRPETLANHPTNWHLSAHRAIAVKDVLQDAGIEAQRFNVAGYGPYRPLVDEEQGQGAEENRRVEIYLVPMTSRERQQIDRVGSGQSQQTQAAGTSQSRETVPASSRNGERDDPGQFK